MASARVDFKLVLLGKGGVGKTCLVRRYLDGIFHLEEASTVGAAYFSKKIMVGSTPVVLGIWDTAGQERFDSMTKIYYRGAEAAVVCYDKNSFERARFWVDELLMNVENCRIYLVGTKADLVDEMGRGKSADDIAHFAKSIDATLNIETSSKTGKAVEDLFYAIADNWVKDHPEATGGVPRTTLGNTLDNPDSIDDCQC